MAQDRPDFREKERWTGHPGNEWADTLADIGRLDPFYHGGHTYSCAYPYELDEHEDTDTAQDRHHATHMLNTAIHSAALPGGAALKLPRDWVMFGDTAKWHTKTVAPNWESKPLLLNRNSAEPGIKTGEATKQ